METRLKLMVIGKGNAATSLYILGIPLSTWTALAWILGLVLLLIAYIVTQNVLFGVLFLLIMGFLVSVKGYNRYYLWKRQHKKKIKILPTEDVVKILLLAKNGISNSTQAIKELNLSQKSYYVNLRALMQAGYITKQDNLGVYKITELGETWLKKSKSE